MPHRIATLAATMVLFICSHANAAEPKALTFEARVRPILKTHCFHCHGEEDKPKAGLDLRLVKAMVKGGVSGAAVEPGSHDGSLIWERIEADQMPPGPKKLSPAEKAAISEWIDSGARVARPEPSTLPPGPVFTDEERAWWAFRPIRRPDPPRVKHAGQVRNPIDAFLLEKLEAKGLAFSPEADRRTLIRRLSFDLTGLPPTPDEVSSFVADESRDAYEKLVDRLLASPRYGERWARHWMDVAGYADSDGNPSSDVVRPYAYKYRDYLIRSLNADRPWDAMLREQLAGDELITSPLDNLSPADRETLAATGFLRNAPDLSADAGADIVQARNDVVAETIKIVSSSLLGLTVGCAQCHAHRYDPIAQEDYFRLRAVLEPALDPSSWKTSAQRQISTWTPDDRKKAAEVDKKIKAVEAERRKKMEELVAQVLEKELAQTPENLRAKLKAARDVPAGKRTDEQKALFKTYPRILVTTGNVSLYDGAAHGKITSQFDAKAAEVRKERPKDDYIHALTEPAGAKPAVTKLAYRGDPKQPRQVIEPGELSILRGTTGEDRIPSDDPKLPTSGRRLAYAKHLTSGKHPLVTRVLINRLWLNHFGRGIVGTPADFGRLGELPTHPELLDWLADDVSRNGWTLKRVHRLMVTSAAYRQSSRRDPEAERVDPENRLLARMSVRRLDAETIRDAVLAVSGKLNTTMFGPPLPVALDESGQVLIGIDTRDSAGRQTGPPGSIGAEEFRRTVYVQMRRSLPLSFTEPFDVPTLTPNCDRRGSSTVAPQSLTLMNSEFMNLRSLDFADRLIKEAGADPTARIRRAWTLALGVEPGPEQVSSALRFLAEQTADYEANPPAAPAPPPARRGKPKAAAKPQPPAKPDADRLALATLGLALVGSNGFLYID